MIFGRIKICQHFFGEKEAIESGSNDIAVGTGTFKSDLHRKLIQAEVGYKTVIAN